jgi:hypothetical protein
MAHHTHTHTHLNGGGRYPPFKFNIITLIITVIFLIFLFAEIWGCCRPLFWFLIIISVIGYSLDHE